MDALDGFYRSGTCRNLSEPRNHLHNMGDLYLVDELILELQRGQWLCMCGGVPVQARLMRRDLRRSGCRMAGARKKRSLPVLCRKICTCLKSEVYSGKWACQTVFSVLIYHNSYAFASEYSFFTSSTYSSMNFSFSATVLYELQTRIAVMAVSLR